MWLRVAVGRRALDLAAAQNAAWFGTPVPPPLSDPRKPIMKHEDAFAPLPAHFLPRPGRHDELLDGAALKTDQRRIVGLLAREPGAGDKVWGAGRRRRLHAHHRMGRERAQGGRLEGREVETYAVPGPMWVPQSWQLQVVGDPAFGAGTETVTLQSAFPQPGGATIPAAASPRGVVFVGHGTDADLAGRDVKGKIAVVRVRPEPSLFGSAEQGVAARLVEKGAVGVINASRVRATRSTSIRASPAARRRASWSAARTAGSSSR
jgi:hypothetical protein